jgi:LGFP repeat
MRDAAATRGITNTSFLFAGIAMDETGLAQCWSEATWACKGPSSPDCGGGPVIAGSADGPCGQQKGGLGMFQFDSGTFNDTLRTYGNDVLTVDGQMRHAVDYVVNMVKISAYTTDAETDEKARAWINRFDIGNAGLRDQWIRTVVRYYNGCQPGWSCWSDRYRTYSEGLNQVLADTGGTAFWKSGKSGMTCPGGGGAVAGAIEARYKALGGCGSVLGVPKTDELGTPDGVGRYTVFDHGSIYWSPEAGAHEVLGVIRDKYKEVGWEAGALGYPVSGEYDVPGGRKSDFQHGAITWKASTNVATVTGAP